MTTILMGTELIKHADILAAAQRYTLTVRNENSQFQQFALYQTLPNIVGASTDPISLAWALGGAAGGTPSKPSLSQFIWQIDYSANAGYIRDIGTTTDPRTFLTSSQASVQVDSQNALDVTYQGPFPNGAPAFPNAPKNAVKGVIQIQSDDLIPTSVKQASQSLSLNVGIAMNGKPTVAVQLLPNLLYQFTPKPRYYILAGSFVQGQVIDTATSTQAFEVAFEGVTDRTVVFNENNQFSNG